MSKIQKATDCIQADTRDEAWNPSSKIPWHSANVIAPLIERAILTASAYRLDLAQNCYK
jgi:hypothetical protein